VTVTIDVGGARRTWRTPFVFVGNNEYEIDGVKMGERARLDEGKLFVYLAPRLRAHQLPLLLAKAVLGRARQSGDFEIVPATELWIGTSRVRRQRVAVDGEVGRMKTPLHYRPMPGARVVVPRDAMRISFICHSFRARRPAPGGRLVALFTRSR
jgi:diacylglycerol kinase family enzyme